MNVVDESEWLAARVRLLEREKAFTREREALAAARRALPMHEVHKPYHFEGARGSVPLAELFAGKRQLVLYHYMLGPSSERGCSNCAYVADHFDGMLPHLAARDVSLVAVARAPFPKLAAFQAQMGWKFPFYSSGGSDFNYDYKVSFTDEQLATHTTGFNYGLTDHRAVDGPGFSVFLQRDGRVFHTYSCFSRGFDQLINTYNVLDITPLGRHEDSDYPMRWVRHHDCYDQT